MNDIKTLESLFAAKKPYLAVHNRNVCNYSDNIAARLKLPEELCEVIRYAALFHDIGKISVPNSILLKPGHLTRKEREIMKLHPVIGAELLPADLFNKEVVEAVYHHHERWDGNGYPDGLAKKDIPMAARIIAVADSFDAMTASRPYKRTLNKNQALEEISRCAGTQFDPEVAGIFISLMDDQKNIVKTSIQRSLSL